MKLLFFSLFVVSSVVLADTPLTTPPPLPAIQIKGRQLLIDGKPFIIKAVCYDPVPQGENYDWNSHALLTYKNEKDLTQEELALIDRDFKAMQEAGVNTIRVYKPITNPAILKKLDAHHLKVIVPVFTYYKDLKNHRFDQNLSDLQDAIRKLKNEKSTLFWEIGNEWNYNCFYSKNAKSTQPTDQSTNGEPLSDEDLKKCLKHIQSSIDRVREIDTTHPISTCLGDIPFKKRPDGGLDLNDFLIESLWKKLPKEIDVYGVNIYDGKSFNSTWDQDGNGVMVPTRFERWKEITKPLDQGGIGPKPLYISEYGATAYNLTKHGVPSFSNYDELEKAVLSIDKYRLYGLKPQSTVLIKKLARDYDNQPVIFDEQGLPYFSIFNVNIEASGEDENAQAEGIKALATEIHNNLSAKDPNNFLLGGAVFEFCDEWWKAPDTDENNPLDPSVHSIRGFTATDCRNTSMVCGGPWPDGYFHEEWFGLFPLDRSKPRPAYEELKKIYTADDDSGLPIGTLPNSN